MQLWNKTQYSSGHGKETMIDTTGDDELTGGQGHDTLLCGTNTAKITDFIASKGDKKISDCEQSQNLALSQGIILQRVKIGMCDL